MRDYLDLRLAWAFTVASVLMIIGVLLSSATVGALHLMGAYWAIWGWVLWAALASWLVGFSAAWLANSEIETSAAL